MEDLTMKLYGEIGNCNLWNENFGTFNKKYYDKQYQKTDKYKEQKKNYYIKKLKMNYLI